MILGGDTLDAFRRDPGLRRGPSGLGVLHFDAHADLREA
jgi:arginase family enzyme